MDLKELDSIINHRDYGTIKLKFRNVMDDRKISRNRLAKLVDVRFEVIDRLYKGNLERLDLDILARICFVLGCKIEDVLEHCPD